MPSLATARVLLVDPDPGLLGLLSALLTEAGCEVETVQGPEGFTADLMALFRPNVVFLNPELPGLEVSVTRAVVKHFRSLCSAPVMVIGTAEAEVLADRALLVGADGYVPTSRLLEKPLDEVPIEGEAIDDAVVVEEDWAGDLDSLEELAPEAILDLELDEPLAVPHRSRPPPPSSAPPAGQPKSALGADILALIREELSESGERPLVVRREVDLDVFTDSNLYGTRPGEVVGIYVVASPPLMAGTEVELLVRFPWGGRVQFTSHVEWSQDASRVGRRQRAGFAVRFPQLSPEDRKAVERFVALRAPAIYAQPGK